MILLTKKREELGWSRAELGRQSGLDGGIVGRIESQRHRPYDVQIKKIAKALKVPNGSAQTLLEELEPVEYELSESAANGGEDSPCLPI